MSTIRKTQPVHADGYQWVQGTISTPGAWTLLDPNGNPAAHAYRGNDRTWSAVLDNGEVIADGLATSGEALKAADNSVRPCAYIDTHSSHGIVPCDNDRAPDSIYCEPHRDK